MAKVKKLKILPIKEQPVHLDMSFQNAVKLALNTPIKKSKINKKK